MHDRARAHRSAAAGGRTRTYVRGRGPPRARVYVAGMHRQRPQSRQRRRQGRPLRRRSTSTYALATGQERRAKGDSEAVTRAWPPVCGLLASHLGIHVHMPSTRHQASVSVTRPCMPAYCAKGGRSRPCLLVPNPTYGLHETMEANLQSGPTTF